MPWGEYIKRNTGAIVAGASMVGMKIRHLWSVASFTSVCSIAAKMNPREF